MSEAIICDICGAIINKLTAVVVYIKIDYRNTCRNSGGMHRPEFHACSEHRKLLIESQGKIHNLISEYLKGLKND